jgi:hypothetical protein
MPSSWSSRPVCVVIKLMSFTLALVSGFRPDCAGVWSSRA